jgi:hypothetical protein
VLVLYAQGKEPLRLYWRFTRSWRAKESSL